jgi:hypothetical protein
MLVWLVLAPLVAAVVVAEQKVDASKTHGSRTTNLYTLKTNDVCGLI